MGWPPPPPPDDDVVETRDLVRVDDADHPDAASRGPTGAVLLEPPTDGTPWTWASMAVPDALDAELHQAVNLPPWHDRGARGAGVRIAVFDLQFGGLETLADDLGVVSTHDCWLSASCAPPLDTVRPRFSFERGVHGAACAEVVHDVAPEAELYVVSVQSRTQLESAVDWAIRNEIDVISMSLSFFNLSFFDGTGPMVAPMQRLREHDILMVTSAGNTGRGHWRGTSADGDGDGWLDLDGGGSLTVDMSPGDRLYLTWDQYGICGATDLDAELRDARGFIVSRGDDEQVPPPFTDARGHRCQPLERLDVPEDGTYTLHVRRRRGSDVDVDVDVMISGGVVPSGSARGSIVDPGMLPGVLTIGAVDARDYVAGDVRVYSSQGPSRTGLIKPDLAGPDGLSTRSYGTRGFAGTSASTPAVAGLVAVVMSDTPGLGPYEAAERLKGWALTDGPDARDDDPRWGAGKARLPLDAVAQGCGRQPLVLGLLLLPLAWRRRRHETDRSGPRGRGRL